MHYQFNISDFYFQLIGSKSSEELNQGSSMGHSKEVSDTYDEQIYSFSADCTHFYFYLECAVRMFLCLTLKHKVDTALICYKF